MKQSAKIGLSLGVIAAAAAVGVAIWLLVKRRKEAQNETTTEGTVTVETDANLWPVYERAPGAPGKNIATRANNPFDIRTTSDKWEGQIGTTRATKGFCVFSDLEHGIRAAFKLLKTYETKYGLKTLKAKMGRWAPAKENRATYPDEIAAGAGVDVNSMAPYNDLNYWLKIMPVWARIEGYEGTLPADAIKRAYKLAFEK